MKIIFLLLMLFITSCHYSKNEDPSEPTKQSLTTEVLNQTILELRKEKGLCAYGYGGRMMHQIARLSLDFNYYNEIDINEARELLMTSGRVFLNNVNSNELIPPFLQNYPFEPENIEVAIYVRKPNGRQPDSDKLAIVTLIDGVLKYKIMPDEYSLETIYHETFEEAQSKLQVANK